MKKSMDKVCRGVDLPASNSGIAPVKQWCRALALIAAIPSAVDAVIRQLQG